MYKYELQAVTSKIKIFIFLMIIAQDWFPVRALLPF